MIKFQMELEVSCGSFKELSLRDNRYEPIASLFFKIFPHPTVWNAGIMAGALAALLDKEDMATYEGWQNSELKWAWFLYKAESTYHFSDFYVGEK